MILNRGGAVPTALLVLAALSTGLLPSPALAQDEGGDDEGAMVRMAHLSPDTPKGDIYVDDAPVEDLQGVPFGAVSPYLELPAGEKKVEIYAEGENPETSEPALEVDAKLEGGERYTVAAVGLLGDDTLAAKLYEDDQVPPADGEAKLRVVHAVPDVGPATVSAEGSEEPLFALPGFANASPYAEVPAERISLTVTPAGADEPAFEADVALAAGEIRTVFIVGEASEGSLDVVETLDREGDAARDAARDAAKTAGLAVAEEGGAEESGAEANAEPGGVKGGETEVPVEPGAPAVVVGPFRQESAYAGDQEYASGSQYAGSYAYPSEPVYAADYAYDAPLFAAPVAPAPVAAPQPVYEAPQEAASPVLPAPPISLPDEGVEVPDLPVPETDAVVGGDGLGGAAGLPNDGVVLPESGDGRLGDGVLKTGGDNAVGSAVRETGNDVENKAGDPGVGVPPVPDLPLP